MDTNKPETLRETYYRLAEERSLSREQLHARLDVYPMLWATTDEMSIDELSRNLKMTKEKALTLLARDFDNLIPKI